jgi:hypothetical protein
MVWLEKCAMTKVNKPFSSFPDPKVDYREHPEEYRVGRGEQGVLTVEPYKSELLPLWRFRTPEDAEASAKAIYRAFLCYKEAHDFVGMDMARKFLQMGFTRSRRYARHRGGRKYADNGKELPERFDAEKQRSAEIFHAVLEKVLADPTYQELKRAHQHALVSRRTQN